MSRPPKQNIVKRPYALLLCPAAAFGLGIWQVYRRNWKLGVIENIEQRTKQDPRLIEPENAKIQYFDEYQPLSFVGRYDFSNQIVVGPRSLITDNVSEIDKDRFRMGGTGYLVVTPFILENSNKKILVNRGWIPYDSKGRFFSRSSGGLSETTEISGLFRTSEPKPLFSFVPESKDQRVQGLRNVQKFSQMLNTEEIYIDLKYARSKDGPVGGQTRINIRNEHLQYSVTWFALAAATSWFWWMKYIK